MSNDPTLQSQADVWYLKPISFHGKQVPVITQNFNGPCSFIAICNILILRGNITIEPPTRRTVSYEHLSQLVAEYLLIRSPNVDISAALSVMPHTQKGLDLNPVFTSPTSFRAATKTAGGELALFSQVGIDLVHGWLVDPDSEEASALREERAEDYDTAVGLIAEADHVAGGLLVPGHQDGQAHPSGSKQQNNWTDLERRKIRNALTIRHFLEQTQSQLTYHGLFHLASTLPEGTLVALFRSSHLSVLYKSGSNGATSTDGEWQVLDDTPQQLTEPATKDTSSDLHSPTDPSSQQDVQTTTRPTSIPNTSPTPVSSTSLSPSQPQTRPPQTTPTPSPSLNPTQTHSHIYTLATDQVFLHEPSVVWERIEDVDGAAGVFVDSTFTRGVPIGGDWARSSGAGSGAQPFPNDLEGGAGGEMSDAELARHLQAEEEHYAREREAYLRQQKRERRLDLDRQRREEEEERRQKELHARRARDGEGKKRECVIM